MADRQEITRRDFLSGMALSLAAGTSMTPLDILAQEQRAAGAYPPALTGLRGSHVGSFEVAHAVALAGARYDRPKEPVDGTYDLVVVGGGISGLAAAYFYRQRRGGRVLVLDNHDDFGGHAKRNEFTVDGRTLVSYGGSQSLESPSLYSDVAKQLLEDVGIDVGRFYEYFDRGWSQRRGLTRGIYFSRDAYGRDVTAESALWDYGRAPDFSRMGEIVAGYPISDTAKAALIDLMSSEEDYLAELDNESKIRLLGRMSYSDFLRRHVGMPEEVVTLVRDTVRGYWGLGLDAISALEGYRYEQPGTRGLDIDLGHETGASLWQSEEPYIFHFPDGNAGVARALVRALVPGELAGTTMEDLVAGRVDYSALDEAGADTRIRLNATAIDVRHAADQSLVEVAYIRQGRPELVRGKHVVLACYNSVIPHICGEVTGTQAEALGYATKTPLAYINIAVRNWRPFAELGMDGIYVPQPALMHSFGLDFPVSVGDYRFAQGPDEPTVLHGSFAGTAPDQGMTAREQNRAGQQRILAMSFDDFESATIRQLDGALGGAGFDPDRDIAAITVNRWPHGYAYEYSELFDPWEYGRDNGPHVVGRQRIGRISVANSDSEAYAYVNGAIDAADRAVREQLDL